MKHTPEPWEYGGPEDHGYINAGRFRICEMAAPHNPTNAADAARIVACVNACAGINPEAVPEMVSLLERLRDRMEADRGEGVIPYELTQYPDKETCWLTELRAVLARAREVTP